MDSTCAIAWVLARSILLCVESALADAVFFGFSYSLHLLQLHFLNLGVSTLSVYIIFQRAYTNIEGQINAKVYWTFYSLGLCCNV